MEHKRFTRDEAIAIVAAIGPPKFPHDCACMVNVDRECGLCNCSVIQREGDFIAGMRHLAEALAAAGVFSDARHELVWVSDCGATEPYNPDDCEDAYSVGDREDCTECDSPVERACQARLVAQTMADKLDAAGIR